MRPSEKLRLRVGINVYILDEDQGQNLKRFAYPFVNGKR